MDQHLLDVGAAQRPYPGETVCGDAWTVQWLPAGCRVALVDGLGHGPEAAAAAMAAVATLTRHADLAPSQALEACHRALKATRGAAAMVVAIDLATSSLNYAGVGNVEGRLCLPGGDSRLVSYRGIVGGYHLHLRAFDLALGPQWLLILHSDGISARFEARTLPELVTRDPQRIADAVLERHGRGHDDETVVVVTPRVARG